MYKIAVVGDRESVCGFAALGLSVFFADEQAQAEKTVHTLAERGYGVIYINRGACRKNRADS